MSWTGFASILSIAPAMPKQSAGLLPFRERAGQLEVFLVHPGGPYWANKDDGAWTIAKGEIMGDEEPLIAARREFEEETGFAPTGEPIALQPVQQAGGKIVHAWAVRADFDAKAVRSNTFTLEWPPRSGRHAVFPEVDRAAWFTLAVARRKILEGQRAFLDELDDQRGTWHV
jgi:predicted NUDIX family NTP pyrophosphohydrolase